MYTDREVNIIHGLFSTYFKNVKIINEENLFKVFFDEEDYEELKRKIEDLQLLDAIRITLKVNGIKFNTFTLTPSSCHII
jgi:spore coat protein CotH